MGACAGLQCRRAMARRRAGRGQYIACLAALRRSAAHGDLLPLFLGPDGATAGTGSDRVGVPRRQSADQPDTEGVAARSEEHTSELQSLMRISYAVFCLKKKKNIRTNTTHTTQQLLTRLADAYTNTTRHI